MVTAVSPVATALMPISQAAAWFFLTRSGDDVAAVYGTVSKAAAFYCAWALFKKFIEGEARELGHISMGTLAIASSGVFGPYYSKLASIGGCALVLLNFGLPAYYILIKWNASKLAQVVKNDTSATGVLWAYIFKIYYVSSMIFWSVALYKIWKLPQLPTPPVSSGYSSVNDKEP